MRNNYESLHENTWLSLRVLTGTVAGDYVYSHETRCQGRIVAVLPFRDTPTGRQYLAKLEVTPAWSSDPTMSAITGGWEGGDIADDAVREVWEEAGYRIKANELIWMGQIFGVKSSDTRYDLYAVNLTGREGFEIPGDDADSAEQFAPALWLFEGRGPRSVLDPIFVAMHAMLPDHYRPWAPPES